MQLHPLMLAIIASAGLGAVIGLIRQWSEQSVDRTKRGEFSGVRTFTFWSVLGCVAAFLTDEFSPAVLPVILAIVGAHFVVPGLRPLPARGAARPPGTTTFAATLLTICVGALVAWQRREEAVLVSAITVVLLGLKHPIHAWTRAFTDTDIRATLQFVAITGVILPLVPNQAYGPFEGFNPYSTWMMVVLISGVGFAGYVLMRLLDARSGIFLTSLLGGLASSTATTLAFSKQSRDDPNNSTNYAMAVAVACSVMPPRVLIVVTFINAELGRQLIVPFALMLAPTIAYVAWIWWRSRTENPAATQPMISNPLSLLTAIKFAGLYAAISFLVKAAAHFDQLQGGLLPLSFVSGLSDVDAISLSIAGNLSSGTVASHLAAQGIVMAAVANSVMKAGLAGMFGSPTLRWHVVVLMAVTVACGVAGILMLGAGGTNL